MRRGYLALLAAVLLVLAFAPTVLAVERFGTQLSGANSVPPLDVDGSGSATVTISDDEQTVSWDVSYSGLTGDPTAGHIHFGGADANGPVMIPFDSLTASGTSGSFAAADYEGGDGLPADWDGVLEAIRGGDAYVNIHTEANPGGEIRGQLAAMPATDTAPTDASRTESVPFVLLLAVAALGAVVAGRRYVVGRRR